MASKLFFLFVFLITINPWFGNRNCHAQQQLPSETFTVKEGLSENVVHALFQDRKGFIWIGTHEGLNRYDGYGFKKYLHHKNDSSSLPNSPVELMTEDEKGNLYILMSLDRSIMDPSTGRFTPVKAKQKLFFSTSFIDGLNFQLHPAWYLYSDRGSPGFKLSPAQINYMGDKIFAAGYYDRFKNLWLVDRTRLVSINEMGHEKIILSDLQLPDQKPLPNSILADANGNLWIRLREKIVCIDQFTAELETTIVQSQIPDLPLNNINALLLDRSNILWIGSFYGLRKLNLDNQHFRHIVYNDSKKELASNFVLGLNIHSGNKLAVQHHYLDSLYSEIDLSDGSTKRLAIDKVPVTKFLEQVLIKNADRVEPAKLKIQLRQIGASKVGLRTLRFGYADHSGVIWSFNNYNQVVNFQDNRTIEIKGTAEGILDDGTYLWIATTNAGLIRYHLTTAARKDYQSSKDPTTLSTNNLLCFTTDEKENLWIGTRGAGLNYFDKKKEIFIRFSEADGLSSNTIYCMVMDGPYLWMGTAKGLCCLDTRTKQFRNFYTADGLMNTEFNRWSAVKDNNGVLYFGGMNGIDYFRSEDVLSSNTDSTAVHITAFKTGNELQPLQPGIKLKPKQNFISFEFAAMDFRNPEATQYMYMLEGASNEWINAENNHTAVFASLGPGKYVFHVKASSQNGIWGTEEALAFQILAPWWKQTWFSIVISVLIVSVLYGIYQFRIRQLRKLYRLRSKISQDLHDEMGATLTSISFLSEVASKQTASGNMAAAQTIEKIGEYSRDMIGEMNDIVWAINPANDKFEKIEDRMQNFAGPLLSARNIQFDLTTDSSMKSISLNMEQRKNLYLIFKEAVNNAAKYSGSDSVKVNMIRENNHIELEISDNGKGFDKNTIQPGNGLINMEQRAKEIKADIIIQSQTGKGTSVKLFMPLAQNT